MASIDPNGLEVARGMYANVETRRTRIERWMRGEEALESSSQRIAEKLSDDRRDSYRGIPEEQKLVYSGKDN